MERYRPALIFLLAFTLCSPAVRPPGHAQVVIKPRPDEAVILAVVDIQPASQKVLAEPLKICNQVLWDDLQFAGNFTLANKGFYPPQPIINKPEDIRYENWAALPFRVNYLTTGTLDLVNGQLIGEFRVFDLKQRSMSFGSRISADPAQARLLAHKWADEIVYQLTAGQSRGIAMTKMVFTSKVGRAKEVFVIDYDGFNRRAITNNGALNLFPQLSADNSMLAFTSNQTGAWEVELRSLVNGSRPRFPIFHGFASTPVISLDGRQIAFSLRSTRQDTDIFISSIDGSGRRNITNHPAVDSSPTWSPSGRQIAFSSYREGAWRIFVCDTDGTNIREIGKTGDADAPAWSPDGRWIAFHWKPSRGANYDIFLADPSSGRISHQLTSQSGNNECPTWSPDGRHIAFQSDRSGSNQIYISLADGSETRMITNHGDNTCPSWGGYPRLTPGN
jgi:TolB protein